MNGEPSIEADFTDRAGRPFSISLYSMRHFEWFLVQRKCPEALKDRLAGGARFTGFTVRGGAEKELRRFELTHLAVFRETLGPVSFRPQPKRPFRLFPEAPCGSNTGAGELPFPVRAETVIAPETVTGVVHAVASGDEFQLVRTGPDGTLAFRLPARLGAWDDMAMRWNASPWRRFACGGGIYFSDKARAVREEDVTPWQVEGEAFARSGVLVAKDGRRAAVTLRLRLVGKALSVELTARGGEVSEIRFGACTDMPSADSFMLPYFTYKTNGGAARPFALCFQECGTPLFHLAFADWTQSNGSDLAAGSFIDDDCSPVSNGGVLYNQKTDGTRNDCYERLVYAFSPVFADVLPFIPNPPSPYRALTADYQWCHVYLGRSRAGEYPAWRNRRRRGLRKVMIHDWETCMRDGNESFTFRTTAAPGKGGDQGMYEFTRFLCDELGYLYGPYNNCCDFAPVNGYWHADRAERRANGEFIPTWNRCYSPRPAWCPEATDEFLPVLQRKYRFNTGYCDVVTCVSPWSRTDYDARVPGAGTFAATYYSYGQTLLRQRRNFGGPLYSEGGCHYLYCGLDDGNFAQDQGYGLSRNPWLVDFDLLRMHPLANNFGMGYPNMFYGRRNVPKETYAMMDRFLAATAAFGHIGYFFTSSHECEEQGYYLLQAIAGKYARSDVADIRYADAAGAFLDTSAAIASGAFRRSQVRVAYADGTVVTANGHAGDELVAVTPGGRMALQPAGWCAFSGDGTVGVVSGQASGCRLDVSVASDYVYLNAHGRHVETPFGTTAGRLLRLREAGGTEEVFLLQGKKAELPYAAEEVVKVDEEGREQGAAAYAVADGRTTLVAQDGAYSFRVTPPAGWRGAAAAAAAEPFAVAADYSAKRGPATNTAIRLSHLFAARYRLRGGKEGQDLSTVGAVFAPATVTCGGVARNGYRTHPPYRTGAGEVSAMWRVKLPAKGALRFSAQVGLEDGHLKSDGVTFSVRVGLPGEAPVEVARLHHDRAAWAPVTADLSAWRGKTVLLHLVADPGPANQTASDWSGWGDVVIE